MCNITLEDAKDAIIAADERRASRNDGAFSIQLSVGRVNVIYGWQSQGERTLRNYGLPYNYKLPREHVAELRDWWEQRHPNTGQLLPPQYSEGTWKINLQWVSTHDNVFNMHIGVTEK